jgi:hypothetical protein
VIVAVGAVRPYPGESKAGDAFVVESTPVGLLIALIDGLGHGQHAASAASSAAEAIRSSVRARPAEILELCHRTLQRGRGAAISIVAIDHLGNGSFAGVGNVRVRLHPESGSTPVLLAAPGIVGHKMRPVKETPFRLAVDGVGILFSDGVTSRVDPLGLESKTLADAATTLLATYAHRTDDASLVLFSNHSTPRFRSA